MSDVRKYVRVYYEVLKDPKFDGIFDDDKCLATWLRLLLLADAMWPSPADIPRSANRKALALLSTAGLIDLLSSHRFRVHGLDAERASRSKSAAQNATLRWSRSRLEGGSPASRGTRFKVLERDDFRCRYCGRGVDQVAIDVDHVIPVREGGTDDLENLVAACVDCNAGKSGHPLRAQVPSGRAADARASEK